MGPFSRLTNTQLVLWSFSLLLGHTFCSTGVEIVFYFCSRDVELVLGSFSLL